MALLAAALVSLASAAQASPGDLDATFGNAGVVVTAGAGAQAANAVVQDPSGNILIAGSAANKPANAGLTGLHSFLVARYTPSGALDPTFNGSGLNAGTSFGGFDDQAFAVGLAPNGDVVAAGETSSLDSGGNHRVAVARYQADGALDPSFGSGGLITTQIRPGQAGENDVAYGVAIQANGNIVVVGTSFTGTTEETFAARYLTNGALDGSFGSGGIVASVLPSPTVRNQLAGVAIDASGRIDIASTACTGGCGTAGETDAAALSRLTPGGALDATFGSGGVATVGTSSTGSSLALSPGGQIVLAGWQPYGVTGQDMFLVSRFTAAGTLDAGFGSGGVVTTAFDSNDDEARSVTVEPASGIVVAAGFSQPGARGTATPHAVAVAEYNPNGSPNTGFGANGQSIKVLGNGENQGFGVVAQPDTSVVVAGSFNVPPTQGAGLLRLQGETVAIAPGAITLTQPAQAPIAASFTVNLATPSSVPVSVNFATTAGSAAPGIDFSPASGTLTFAPGQTSVPLNITILNGTAATPDVSFTVNLSGAVNAGILVPAATVGLHHSGYRLVGSDGGIYAFGNSPFFGSTGSTKLNKPIVGIARTPDNQGYWLVASDGGIFAFGDAKFFGSMGGQHLNAPIVGIATTPDGGGYWLVGSDGGIYAFGDAAFFGSTGSLKLNKPIVGLAAAPTGQGYWFVGSDGGIYAFGSGAQFFGSTGSLKLNAPIVGMAAAPNGQGYWLVGSDGGVYAFGSGAPFFGSTGSLKLNKPIVGMAASPTGQGYWFSGSDGGIFNYGNAALYGSTGSLKLNAPVVGIAGS